MSDIIETYRCQVTRSQAKAINERIAAIDPKACFIRHYQAGNKIHGWLERPNDGTTNEDWRQAELQKMRKIADEVLFSVIRIRESY